MMKNLTFSFLALVTAAVAYAADAEGLSGKWSVHTSAAGRENDQTCEFAQKGADLTGNCKSQRGTVNVTGKVDGKKVTWTYKSESEGGMVTVVFNGTSESATKMSGTVLAVEYSVEGEFSATRAN
ncbi:MAG: hypothetical protein HY820_36780 [Acidobacteria bacterium]|nr:hypothetical protein [Acidobacteriota bacterium]